jgi:hypothetical protein
MQLSPETLQLIGVGIAVVSIIVGIILGLQSAKDWSKDRNAGLFLQYQLQAFNMEFMENLNEINSIWSWKNPEDFWAKYGPETNPKEFAKFSVVGTVFDSMGVLLKQKYIPVDMVPELMIIGVMAFWAKVGPIANQLSIDMQRPHAFENIEHLFNEIQKRDANRSSTEG